MSLAKLYVVIFLTALMTACGGGGGAPASTDAVWDEANWDEKNWQ